MSQNALFQSSAGVLAGMSGEIGGTPAIGAALQEGRAFGGVYPLGSYAYPPGRGGYPMGRGVYPEGEAFPRWVEGSTHWVAMSTRRVEGVTRWVEGSTQKGKRSPAG